MLLPTSVFLIHCIFFAFIKTVGQTYFILYTEIERYTSRNKGIFYVCIVIINYQYEKQNKLTEIHLMESKKVYTYWIRV